ncbi:DUF2332 domain-containing protein [Novosphingobium sp. CECT 9465]|uniref:DUF2332 domain-containing protein n=1 Tax=Novosphingobium sp. CECT 9465 TaxID=2829794 RepID=UPI001E3C33A9|nr:DUF2332 family protein [Novosphingobium sp. CECT 9465]
MSGLVHILPLDRADRPVLHQGDRCAAYFEREAGKAAALGASYVASVLEACAHTLSLAPCLHALIRNWPDDLASSGVAFRLNAGLHALARSGRAPLLSQLSQTDSAIGFDLAVAQALTTNEDAMLRWVSRPTQTNEVARIAGLMGVLAELDRRHGLRSELLELGSSAGLNLNLAHYAFKLGGTLMGPRDSAVSIAPNWRGQAVPAMLPFIASARGADLAPLDIARPDHRERLYACTWPGIPARMKRLRGAIEIAHQHVPHVEQGSAGPWLARQLAQPQPEGVRRVVFHSMVMQYVPQPERDSVARSLRRAGARATPERQLARVGLEWCKDRRDVELRLTLWDGTCAAGREAVVATCHPYAEWFDWRGISPALD